MRFDKKHEIYVHRRNKTQACGEKFSGKWRAFLTDRPRDKYIYMRV